MKKNDLVLKFDELVVNNFTVTELVLNKIFCKI